MGSKFPLPVLLLEGEILIFGLPYVLLFKKANICNDFCWGCSPFLEILQQLCRIRFYGRLIDQVFNDGFYFGKITVTQERQEIGQFFRGKVPPTQSKEHGNQFFIKALPDWFRRISAHKSIWLYIFGNHGICGDDSPVAYMDAG